MIYRRKRREDGKWDAYDRQRKQIGVELVRGKTIPKGLFHLVVNVLVQDSKGAFLFVKRSQEKEIHPGVYECGAGGSVLSGEKSLDAALRELKEETGLTPRTIHLIHQETVEEEQSHYDYYLASLDEIRPKVRYQEGETEGHSWVQREELLHFLRLIPIFMIKKSCLSKSSKGIICYNSKRIKKGRSLWQ